MESTAELEIISGAESGVELNSVSEAGLLEGSGSEFVLKEILRIGVATGSELEAVGSVLKANSGLEQVFESTQGTETRRSFSGTEPGLGPGVTFLHILRGGLGDECLSTTM